MVKWWEFLLLSVLIIVIVIGVQTYSTNMTLKTLKFEEKIASLEQTVSNLEQELSDTRAYTKELEDKLSNASKTVHTILPKSEVSSRSSREHSTETMKVLSYSGFSVEWFDLALDGTGMAGLGRALCHAEQSTGVNAVVLAGILALESDWGRSSIAKNKNNLAGICAYSGSAYASAKTFHSRDDCVLYLANMLKKNYLSPDGKYYNGDNLVAIGKRYAEDPAWSHKVATRMAQITRKVVN